MVRVLDNFYNPDRTSDLVTRSHITKSPFDDPRDIYDPEKWDFPDKDLLVYYVSDYPYKINDTGSPSGNQKSVNRLVCIREAISSLCFKVFMYLKENITTMDPELANGLMSFVDIHGHLKRSNKDSIYYTDQFNLKLKNNNNYSEKYLLSELPLNNKVAMQFNGLDVPKMRYIDDSSQPIGLDGKIRCCYRDIYIANKMKGKELKDLIIHELSHTICSHQLYRPNDHHLQFKQAEKLLKLLARDISFECKDQNQSFLFGP